MSNSALHKENEQTQDFINHLAFNKFLEEITSVFDSKEVGSI